MEILTDVEITSLLSERKILPNDHSKQFKTKRKSHKKHEEKEVEVVGEAGHRFAVVLRRSKEDPKSFSIILKYVDAASNGCVILTRYNGSHMHTNILEGVRIRGFHIHKATGRYQRQGLRAEGYAELTDSYSTYEGALETFLSDLGFADQGCKRLEDFPEA